MTSPQPLGASAESAVIRPTTDPTALFDLAEGMHAIEALTASVAWLRVCEWLATNPSDEEKICSALGLARRPGRVLVTLLASLGLVARDRGGVYSVTRMAREYMLPDSPWSLVPCFEALKDRPPCLSMLNALRTGRPMGAPDAGTSQTITPEEGPPSWAAGMDEEAFAEFFLQAIDSRNSYLSHALSDVLDLARRERLLDVGGGSGIYACALAARNAHLQATVLEKPPVDAIARRAIARRNLSDRVVVMAGDMMTLPLPSGHDVHLYSNVVHDWDEDTARQLFRASFAALPAGGEIVLHDAFFDDSEVGPRAVAAYSVLLMSFTSGRCYSVPEVRSFLDAAGFTRITHRPTAVHRSIVTALKPRGAERRPSGGAQGKRS